LIGKIEKLGFLGAAKQKVKFFSWFFLKALQKINCVLFLLFILNSIQNIKKINFNII